MTHNDIKELLTLVRKNIGNIHYDVMHEKKDVALTDRLRVVTDQMDAILSVFEDTGVQPAADIAVQYMRNQPNASADKVCEFVKQVMETIKTI